MTCRVVLSWSSGKDSAWMLHILRQDPGVEIVGLLTTFRDATDRVAMHDVRRALVAAQARETELPLWSVPLPWPCSNAEYERRTAAEWTRCRELGATHVAFGDLYLEEIRDYRVHQLAGTDLGPLFPIWCGRDGTADLARAMTRSGLRAIVTCVDPQQLDPRFLGREFDDAFLADLPSGVDPCGENGEFHTFCYAGPAFRRPIPVERGTAVQRDGFHLLDLTGA